MSKDIKKVAVFTGTRAEYGLLYWLMKDIEKDNALELQVLVTGSHLSPEFGETYRQIEKDGFHIDEKVEMLLSSDTQVGTAKSIGLGMIGFADALARMQPDVLVILGDRFEALAAAQTAYVMQIPVVHLHGGEITEGANDEAFRHAISKFSYLHGTSTEAHRERVIQLGESPERVKNVGAMGLDHLERSSFMTRKALSESLNFDLNDPYFIATYHPVTLATEDPEETFTALLDALEQYPQYKVILTYPNADEGGRKVIPLLEAFAAKHQDRIYAIPSLGVQRYLSAVKHADAVIGNSSSGIIEVPSFSVPTVNIGSRQQGRTAANSVFHCTPDKASILQAIEEAANWFRQHQGMPADNPYGKGNASQQVIQMIKSMSYNPVKTFYDVK
ncbi:UDP-N-acetylglucosamine 2-epimerase (hydrolyzing) [Veronia nyctiphanis]|uniref:UDP-N-acetylglucosamine 2-epimerase (Hydrolyzing) n=1 Tax=Veronia nyctiphanis TaxID=1278244 RepID=A0A4Q0YQF9_9GAMM|nr:UDP-N-acetylglucosamine 2-epimerase [Veronia nyctiphanis]RXJ72805.1 UDP-N-acetylglucosamine 2-epimerase (hydrolyzing) [Veronia nyctiphanis]